MGQSGYEVADIRLDNRTFLERCAKLGLATQEAVGSVFCVTSQTVRTWASRPEDEVPRWLALAMAGYEAWLAGPAGATLPHFPPVDAGWFREWGLKHGLETYEAQGRQFGHSRQTVCKWVKRGMPEWLPLACLGLESGASRISSATSNSYPGHGNLKDSA